jgi:hypothetical protein
MPRVAKGAFIEEKLGLEMVRELTSAHDAVHPPQGTGTSLLNEHDLLELPYRLNFDTEISLLSESHLLEYPCD